MSPTPLFTEPPQPQRSGLLTALVAGALIALVAANIYLYVQIDHVRTDVTKMHESLMTELSKWSWVPHGMLNVTVRDGIVDLWGSITDDRERQALIVAAENVPGVKSVHDHLVWIEPMSGMAVLPPEEDVGQAKAS